MTKPAVDELLDIPLADPATPDLICWLWAAIPTRHGKIHVTTAAKALDVSESTIRRWLKAPGDWELTPASIARLKQRAILRGRGHYLWPSLDEGSIARGQAQLDVALASLAMQREDPARIPPTWHTTGALKPHQVHLVRYPAAHVYAVAITSSPKTVQRLQRLGAQVVTSRKVASKWEAWTVKHTALNKVAEHRCIVPAAMLPVGRTDTFREVGGPIRLPNLPARGHGPRGSRGLSG